MTRSSKKFYRKCMLWGAMEILFLSALLSIMYLVYPGAFKYERERVGYCDTEHWAKQYLEGQETWVAVTNVNGEAWMYYLKHTEGKGL